MIGIVQHIYSYVVSSTPLHLWVFVKNSGTVVCGQCSRMVGLGETSSQIGHFVLGGVPSLEKRGRKLYFKS